MQPLRNAVHLARFVLAWFVLATGVAIASPVVHPQAMELICSAAGVMKLQKVSDDGAAAQAAVLQDCPLCMPTAAPPPVAPQAAMPLFALSHALLPIPAAHIASRTAAPLPARGPPAFS